MAAGWEGRQHGALLEAPRGKAPSTVVLRSTTGVEYIQHYKGSGL